MHPQYVKHFNNRYSHVEIFSHAMSVSCAINRAF